MATEKNQLNAVVTQRIDNAPGLITIRVAPDGWKLPSFTPGQFTVLGLPPSAPRCETADLENEQLGQGKLIKRAYSIASSSVVNEYVEFYVSLVRSGQLTPRLFNLKVGDRLWLSPKCAGYFTLDGVPPHMNIILVATGTGLAPYMSMIRSELSYEQRRRVAIIHGAYHSWDLGYHGELVTLARMHPLLTYIPVVSAPEEEPVTWAGQTGFVQGTWRSRMIDETWGFPPGPDNAHIFLCGHPDMIAAMEDIIKEEGFTEHSPRSPGQYHLERYWQE